MARKSEYTTAIDTAIGEKINALRITLGLSRQQLSAKIGVTHQQLQKYEKGTNRISAGRLAAISQAMKKPIEYFFDGIIEVQEDVLNQQDRARLELNRNYAKLKPAVKISVGNHVRTLAQNS